MYQSEALWLNFGTQGSQDPVALRVFAGGVNGLSGQPDLGISLETQGRSTAKGVTEKDSEQDYVVVPGQPWLDGFVSSNREVRYVKLSRQPVSLRLNVLAVQQGNLLPHPLRAG